MHRLCLGFFLCLGRCVWGGRRRRAQIGRPHMRARPPACAQPGTPGGWPHTATNRRAGRAGAKNNAQPPLPDARSLSHGALPLPLSQSTSASSCPASWRPTCLTSGRTWVSEWARSPEGRGGNRGEAATDKGGEREGMPLVSLDPPLTSPTPPPPRPLPPAPSQRPPGPHLCGLDAHHLRPLPGVRTGPPGEAGVW